MQYLCEVSESGDDSICACWIGIIVVQFSMQLKYLLYVV